MLQLLTLFASIILQPELNAELRFTRDLISETINSGQLENIVKFINFEDFEAKICGEKTHHFKLTSHLTLMSKQFHVIENITDFHSYHHKTPGISEVNVSNVNDNLIIEMSVNLTSSMHFVSTLNLKIFAKKNYENKWKINEVEVEGGECAHMKDEVDEVYPNWTPKYTPNVTSEEFMNKVINEIIPFNDYVNEKRVHYLDLFYNNFLARIDVRSTFNDGYDIYEFMNYWKTFMKRYKIRRDIQVRTKIITNQSDHIVFRSFIYFENLVSRSSLDLWDFQIEAIFNDDLEERWKIAKIFVRPPNIGIEFFRNIAYWELIDSIEPLIAQIGMSDYPKSNVSCEQVIVNTTELQNLPQLVRTTLSGMNIMEAHSENQILDSIFDRGSCLRFRYFYKNNGTGMKTDVKFYVEYDSSNERYLLGKTFRIECPSPVPVRVDDLSADELRPRLIENNVYDKEC